VDALALSRTEVRRLHDVPGGIVQVQPDEFKLSQGTQPLGQLLKRRLEVAVRANGFGNLQEGPVLLKIDLRSVRFHRSVLGREPGDGVRYRF